MVKKIHTPVETAALQSPSLRQQAEEILQKKQLGRKHVSPANARQLVHELEVHQIELEMQNEELRRAQVELEDQRTRYFDLYDLAPAGYLTLNDKGLIFEANLKACLLLDTDRNKLASQPLSRFIAAEDTDSYYLHHKNLFATKEPQAYEIRLRRKDGTCVWVHLVESAATGDNGEAICRVVLNDITKLKTTEETLIKSEYAVRNKLKAIIEPQGDIEALELRDIIDIDDLQSMMEDFHQLTGLTCAILDISGSILVSVGWQDICTKFHRCHPETQKNCIESDTILSSGVPEGTFKTYCCKNNLQDMATPIIVGGKHLGNFFIGQFFYDDSTPDMELFRNQARRYGFNEEDYLAAVNRVPRLNRETITAGMNFYAKLARTIASQSYYTIQLARALSEREQAEQALLKSQGSYRELVENANSIIVRLKPDGTIIFFNEFAEKFFGFSKQEILGQSVIGTIVPERDSENNDLSKMVQNIFENPEEYSSNENENICKDGSRVWISWTNKIIFDIEGNIIELLSIGQDITERKRAELALQESELHFRLLFEGSRDGFVSVDKNGCFIDANEAYCRMLGYSIDELRSMTDFYRITPEKWHDWEREEIWQKQLLKKGFTDVYEKEYIRKDGTVFPAELQAYRVHDKKDHIDYFWGVARDITERKKAEEALEAKNEELVRFNYTVSHDLKAPLVTIKTFLGFLEQKLKSGDTQNTDEDMGYLHSAADKMNALLEDLLKLGRIGRVENLPVETSLQEIAQEALGLIAGRIAERKVHITITEQPCMLYGDRSRLIEVFQNLLDNAVQFMGDQSKPEIEIGTAEKNGEVAFFVRDNGIGIDPRHIHKLFNMFQKLDANTKGTGIGLTLVKGIVELHNGRVWVESEGIGKGACFWFTLPKKQIQG